MKMIVSGVLLFYVERGIFQFIETAAKKTRQERWPALGHGQQEGFHYLAVNSKCAATWLTTPTWQIREHARRTFTAHLFQLRQKLTAEIGANLTSASMKLPASSSPSGLCREMSRQPSSPPCPAGGRWVSRTFLAPQNGEANLPHVRAARWWCRDRLRKQTLQDFLVPPTILRCLRSDRSTDATQSLNSLGRCVSSEGR